MIYERENDFYPPFLFFPFNIIFHSSHIAIVDDGENKKLTMKKEKNVQINWIICVCVILFACVCRFLWLAVEMSVFVSPSVSLLVSFISRSLWVKTKKYSVWCVLLSYFDHLVFNSLPTGLARIQKLSRIFCTKIKLFWIVQMWNKKN